MAVAMPLMSRASVAPIPVRTAPIQSAVQVPGWTVFGVPDEEWGERVMAVIEPAADRTPGPGLAAEILGSLDGKLARLKWPTAVDFTSEMPRDPSDKLLKRRLREPYWQAQGRSI